MKIAFFDFDGTITTKDSLPDFIKFAIGKPKYYLGLCLLSPILLAYVLKLLPNHSAKEKMISYYFKGWSEKNFQTVADEYAAHQIDKIVRPKALEKLHWHQEQGHKVVIVSASMKSWLKQW
ncbi:MAG: HAD family hydrolase, partial [Methylococcales bacterium]